MAPITTIVQFQVPAENVDRFFAFWQDPIKDEMRRQPGLIDGVLHRAADPDGPFQFVNVARWENAESLAAALRATDEALRREGVVIADVFADLGVTMSQHNYVEAVPYDGTAPSASSS
jgi:antibiotic biosynthesis monooxygenase (ABM) superfamily enzyme